jgi:hypothetical protein
LQAGVISREAVQGERLESDVGRRVVHCALAILLLPALLGVLAVGAVGIVILAILQFLGAVDSRSDSTK